MSESKGSLSGLRLLITRPQRQAKKWQQLLQREGASTECVSMMEIVPIGSDNCNQEAVQAIKSVIMDLDRYQHVIFVSQNAAQFGAEWIDQYWPQIPVGLKFYAVGRATAEVLEQAGFEVIAAGGTMNSEALLLRPELQQLHEQKVAIFRGLGGRTLLAEMLRERGAQVDYCELYQRLLPQQAADALSRLNWCQQGDLITIQSGETLLNLCQVIRSLSDQGILDYGRWLQLPLLLPGERVAKLASDQGFTEIIMADNASDSCMLNTLLEWQATR